MKWLGTVSEPKDLTTKEYVDSADNELQESIKTTKDTLKALDSKKVNSEDIQSFTESEITALWIKHIK